MDSTKEVEKLSSIEANSRHSGFGVIIDSTRGIKTFQQENFTQLRIIDSSLNPMSPSNGESGIPILIYWKNATNEPFTRKIGDIIRFENFEFSVYKDHLQGKNRKGSSWELFAGDEMERNESYAKSIEFREDDEDFVKSRLKELRTWNLEFFGRNSIKSMHWYSFDKIVENAISNFDLLVKIQAIEEKNRALLLRVYDDSQLIQYNTIVSLSYSPILQVGDVIKLRSIEKIQGNSLIPNPKYNSVLGIPKNFRDAKNFPDYVILEEQKVDEEQQIPKESQNRNPNQNQNDLQMQIEAPIESASIQEIGQSKKWYEGYNIYKAKKMRVGTGEQVTASTVLQKYKSIAASRMSDLVIPEISSQIKSPKNDRLRFVGWLFHIWPKRLIDAVRNECVICKGMRRLDSDEGNVCCEREMRKIYLMKMLWKDKTIRNTEQFLVTWLFTSGDGNPEHIFQEIDLQKITNDNLNEWEGKFEGVVRDLLKPDRVYEFLATRLETAYENLDEQVPMRIIDTVILEIEEDA